MKPKSASRSALMKKFQCKMCFIHFETVCCIGIMSHSAFNHLLFIQTKRANLRSKSQSAELERTIYHAETLKYLIIFRAKAAAISSF